MFRFMSNLITKGSRFMIRELSMLYVKGMSILFIVTTLVERIYPIVSGKEVNDMLGMYGFITGLGTFGYLLVLTTIFLVGVLLKIVETIKNSTKNMRKDSKEEAK